MSKYLLYACSEIVLPHKEGFGEECRRMSIAMRGTVFVSPALEGHLLIQEERCIDQRSTRRSMPFLVYLLLCAPGHVALVDQF